MMSTRGGSRIPANGVPEFTFRSIAVVTPRQGDDPSQRTTTGATMSTAEWYYAQAGLFRDRAEACRQLAGRLDRAAVFDLHQYSGELTWEGPVALEFDRVLAGHCAELQAAIDALHVNAFGLSADADDYERRGAIALYDSA
jgi:hypothetical protein